MSDPEDSEPPEPFGLDPTAAPAHRPLGPDPTAVPPPGPLGLDPDAVLADREREDSDLNLFGLPRVEPVIDTRRYQRMVGLIGLVVLAAFSVFLFARGGNGTPGVAPGQHLHRFVAPLATGGLDATVNAHPVCDPARPARRGLNVCGRRPLVLAFFALGAKPCVRQVDALQAVAQQPAFHGIQFAAVAEGASQAATAAAVRAHHWTTIPVAYDSSGVTSQLFGVEVCPLVELARRGGVVTRRLIGEHWLTPGNLAAAVATLER